MSQPPTIILIGGPNGAGKTTISKAVIAESLGVAEFVNADIIAKGLSGFDPDRAALAAGRIMLARLKELASARTSFAFESTLASRSFAPWLRGLTASGYGLILVFVWLRTPALAVERVRHRITEGGHAVPPEVIRRRYARGIANFIHLYLPLASRWQVYDNSEFRKPRLVASRHAGEGPVIVRDAAWKQIVRIANEEANESDR